MDIPRGLDRWIEGNGKYQGASSEWGTKRREPPQSARVSVPTQLKAIASPYADLSPTELLARLRASLERTKR